MVRLAHQGLTDDDDDDVWSNRNYKEAVKIRQIAGCVMDDQGIGISIHQRQITLLWTRYTTDMVGPQSTLFIRYHRSGLANFKPQDGHIIRYGLLWGPQWFVCVCVCVCVCVYVYIYIYTHTHTHTKRERERARGVAEIITQKTVINKK